MTAAPYRVRIGLEIHAQVTTASKAFCACPTSFTAEPNTRVCPVCLGHPGALPVPNAAMVEAALRVGLALGCAIRSLSRFARKNYFYPDLPKGYQITQYTEPICEGGCLRFELPDGTARSLPLTRIHIEEDAAKLFHDRGDRTLVDCNRAGIPLLEIVTEPELASPEEAAACFRELRRILRTLGVCDGNMERGSLRCDANISLCRAEVSDGTDGAPGDGTPEDGALGDARSEIKNLNSFSALLHALAAERQRQEAVMDAGGRIERATLHWDEQRACTVLMRGKEASRDYRYFDEPDIPPLAVTDAMLRSAGRALPELPLERRDRLLREGALPRADANTLVDHPSLADLFDDACAHLSVRDERRMRSVAHWILRDLRHAMKSADTVQSSETTQSAAIDAAPPVDGAGLAALVDAEAEGALTRGAASEAFALAFGSGRSLTAILAETQSTAVSEEELRRCAGSVLEENAKAARRYLDGKPEALDFLIGAVMRRLGGRATPAAVRAALLDALQDDGDAPPLPSAAQADEAQT